MWRWIPGLTDCRVPSATLTETVEHSAAPAAVAVAIDRLARRTRVWRPASTLTRSCATRSSRSPRPAAALTASAAPTRSAIDVLAQLDRRPGLEADDAVALAGWKRLELLRIAARDLLGVDGLEAVVVALSTWRPTSSMPRGGSRVRRRWP